MSKVKNVISVDVENWTSRRVVRRFSSRKPCNELDMDGVVESVKHLLTMFREFGRVGTFFVLGTVAESDPEILELIARDGHEIGVHSYKHRNLDQVSSEELRLGLRRTKSLIQRTVRSRPAGFRAPAFSLTRKASWVLGLLQEEGFSYDSSVLPSIGFDTIFQGRNGRSNAPTSPYFPSHKNPFYESSRQDETLVEFPVLTRRVLGLKIPAGGGFYLRLFGERFVLDAIKRMNKEGLPAMCYLHNWEVGSFHKDSLPMGVSAFAFLGIPADKMVAHLLQQVETATAAEVLEEGGF